MCSDLINAKEKIFVFHLSVRIFREIFLFCDIKISPEIQFSLNNILKRCHEKKSFLKKVSSIISFSFHFIYLFTIFL